ncbi:MAG: phosphoribosylanthranilate isomerase [Gammaproteobacteria bacterium]|nr:phosphoribosylanthranilate isomerase [Gammaproteobacteria bacterium]
MTKRTRVKICGITTVGMAREAVKHGADAIGLVFYPPSPRHLTIEQATEIVASLPAFVTAVGLFVNEQADEISHIISKTKINLLQFHGNECPDYCASFDFPYIKALRMTEDVDLFKQRSDYSAAQSLLLDTYRAGVPGGTGEAFDWDRIPRELAEEVILAGGLEADNITRAIQRVKPYAVDVSGGVESSKGVKSPEKIRQFMQGVKIADQ